MILEPPTNYTGSKHKILNRLFEHFPESQTVETFYDVFAGGLSVTVNSPYTNVVANDIIKPLISFYSNLQTEALKNKTENELEKIKSFAIDKNSSEDYNKIRELFNETEDPYLFFALVSSCTNNFMRFNKKFKFNQTFGKRTINEKTITKLKNYAEVFKRKNIKFTSFSFTELIDKFNITANDFVYLDPPYLITEAGYNAYWSLALENQLYELLDYLDGRNIRFIMSNVSKHKERINPNLERLKKYHLVNIENDYEKVAKNKIGETQEIIVKNF